MSRLLWLAFFVTSTAFATPLQDALVKFPPLQLPIHDTGKKTASVALTQGDIDAFGFATLANAPKELASWTPVKKGTTRTLVAKGSAKVNENTLLLLQYVDVFRMGAFSRTFVVVVAGETVVSATLLHRAETGEVGDTVSDATLAVDGSITRTVKSEIQLFDQNMPKTMEVTLLESQTLLADGTWEPLHSSATTRTGKYVDAKSKEELWVFDSLVFYQAGPTKLSEQLEFDGHTARFKGSNAKYSLVWDATKRFITCTDPKGRPQTFTRVW